MLKTFKAGCGRETSLEIKEEVLAYQELDFEECGGCEHRLEPLTSPPFCLWHLSTRPHPFASLAHLPQDFLKEL
ncbi:MAG: hypothetical protein R2880_06835 [Deinococcales bacterium]